VSNSRVICEGLIRAEVKERLDITLAELAEKVAKVSGQQRVSVMTMSDELRRPKLRRKRTIYAAERDSERVQIKRREYRLKIAAALISGFKFLDEAGSNIAMTRLYGRAAPGELVNEAAPLHYGENITMLAALSPLRGRRADDD
jgi:hypothetical protein